MENNNIGVPSVVTNAKTIADTFQKLVYENPAKKSEYALDEKVKEKILSDDSIPYTDRLTLCYGYAKIKKEFKRRKNVLDLANKYFNRGTDNFYKSIEQLDEDWFDFFIERVERTSSERFKSIWARLLSAQLTNIECERGLTISKKLIANICLLTPEDITAFRSICGMTFESLDREISKYPFIYIIDSAKFLANYHVRRYNLASLNQLGLIEYSGPATSFVLPKKTPKLKYHNMIIEFIENEGQNHRINIGNVRLTSDGRVLYGLTESTYIPGFLDICKNAWDKKGYRYKIQESVPNT